MIFKLRNAWQKPQIVAKYKIFQCVYTITPVSYTHLDVYKRQAMGLAKDRKSATGGQYVWTKKFVMYATHIHKHIHLHICLPSCTIFESVNEEDF